MNPNTRQSTVSIALALLVALSTGAVPVAAQSGSPSVSASGGQATPGGTATVEVTMQDAQTIKLSDVPRDWTIASRQDAGATPNDQVSSEGIVGWVWTDGDQSSKTVSVTFAVPDDATVDDYPLAVTVESQSGDTNVTSATVAVDDATADGFVRGTVRDTNNDPVANADVRVTGPGFDRTFADATDANGDYAVGVPGIGSDGSYTVEVTKSGFEPFTTTGVVVAPGATTRVDVTMVASAPGVESVDVRQVGVTDAVGSSVRQFADTTDGFAQRVPRDGTIDVFDVVTTTSDGTAVNATAIVEVEDSPAAPVDGGYPAVTGGRLLATSDGGDVARITTGADGTARVYFETGESAADRRTNLTATLAADAAVSDRSAIELVGVTSFRTASVSGIVTDASDTPVPDSAVWAERFDYGPDVAPSVDGVQEASRFVVEPETTAAPGTADYAAAVDSDDDAFVVRRQVGTYDEAAGTVDYRTVGTDTATVAELRAYEFAAFPEVATDTPHELYDRATGTADASYVLDPVPAVDGGETDYRVAAVKFGSQPAQYQGITGAPARASVLPGTTDDANVVYPTDGNGTAGGALSVSGLSAPSRAAPSDTITVTATVTNAGSASTDLRAVSYRIDTDGDGRLGDAEEVLSATVDPLAPGASTTVAFDVPPSSVTSGEYTHGVVAENGDGPGDDSVATAALTVTSPSSDGLRTELADGEPIRASPGETVEVPVTVRGATDGLLAVRNVEVRVGNASVATVAPDATVADAPGDPGAVRTGDFPAGETSVVDRTDEAVNFSASAITAATPTGDVVVGYVRLRTTDTPGRTALDLTVREGLDGARSDVRLDARDATLDTTPTTNPFPGGVPGVGPAPPTDPAPGDSGYEDVDGDGDADFDDVIDLLFAIDRLSDAPLTAEQVAAVDYDGDGTASFDDVVALLFRVV